MAIKGVDHVNVTVADAGPVVDFYCNNLGFSLQSKIDRPDMTIYYLNNANSQGVSTHCDCVEIIQPQDASSLKTQGLKHIALLSDNIQEDFDSCKAKGLKLLHEDVQQSANMMFFFMRSPGSEWIEIVQHKENK